MPFLRDEDIRRVLEESDGEDLLFDNYDLEEIVEMDNLQLDENVEESIEAISADIQNAGAIGESACSEIFSEQSGDAELVTLQCQISNGLNANNSTNAVPPRAQRPRQARSRPPPLSEWSFEVKDLRRKIFTRHDEPIRHSHLFDSNTDIFTILS
ncbi:unnamed protein product [Euphydryas editha]|uniref:Uncharacterized protein n=1 Tax=Euphydryas editha TaxID=104508 RepID=A0AAU9TQB6_EUPED|nr:unnamed protein product [Euphydryas editha]